MLSAGLHFVSTTLLYFASVLHFTAITTFCVNVITFCGVTREIGDFCMWATVAIELNPGRVRTTPGVDGISGANGGGGLEIKHTTISELYLILFRVL